MTDGALERLDALRHEAVRQVTDACMSAQPEIESRFGVRGREACGEDIHFHLDFLRSALEADDPSVFTRYLGWLARVLESRGVPVDSLPLSLDALREFYESRLGADAAGISGMLAEARCALDAGLDPPVYDQPCPSPWEEAEAFREAALAGDRAGAAEVFKLALARSGSLHEAEVHVIQPAMYEIGRLWQENMVSVAQEHLASAIAQTLMAQAYGLTGPTDTVDRSALFACSAGNQHAIGLRMVADAFEYAGWTVHFLGANTPSAALIQHARAFNPDIIGLSASLPYQLKGVRETVGALRDALGPDCPRIVVGGLVFNQFPELAEAVGAELLGADSVSSVAALVAA
ncbi:MAG: cobalamin-dependent protein [Gammaproteobacteria bacterium]|nr:cobalamin-dependent protein [Gammaproteobacteria bacterium]